MSKDEQIKQAAKERFPNEGWVFHRVAFVEGARWADEHLVKQVADNQDMFYDRCHDNEAKRNTRRSR